MTLDEYLEHLTDNNWHTLRNLIELERGMIGDLEEQEFMLKAYQKALDYVVRN